MGRKKKGRRRKRKRKIINKGNCSNRLVKIENGGRRRRKRERKRTRRGIMEMKLLQ